MKVDRKALCFGVALLAAVPLLMLRQSSNPSEGTSKGWSKYNVYHEISLITEQLHYRRPRLLHPLCLYTLGDTPYANYAYTKAWIDRLAAECGECSDVHLGRAWLANSRGDADGVRREFAAAVAAARDDKEREYVLNMIGASRR